MKNDPPQHLSDFRALYNRADEFAREIAEFRSEIAHLAYNQLRYAGHYLLQALDDSGSISSNEQLRRASSHCERAMYEAAEAGIISVLDSIDQFRKEYKRIVIKDIVDDYASIILQCRKALDLLVRGRSGQMSSSERVACYIETFRQLRDAKELLNANRDDLNAKQSKQVQDRRRFILGLLVLIFGTITTIVLKVLG